MKIIYLICFLVCAQTIHAQSPLPLPADLNGDYDVDGADFLAWQIDQSLVPLETWEDTYGNFICGDHSDICNFLSVPEPSTQLLLASVLVTTLSWRRAD